MTALRRLLLSAALLASVGTPAGAQVELPSPPASPSAGETPVAAARVRVTSDPRLELMSLLISRTRQGKLQQDDTAIAYRAAAAAAVKAHDAHAAIRLLEELQAEGFVGALPYQFAMHLTAPGMTLDAPLPDEFGARAEKLSALAAAMQAYAAETRFMDFYGGQKALFANLSQKIGALLKVDDVAGRVEAFYGTHWDRITVVPAPLLARAGVGFPVIRPDGTREVVAVIGPMGATPQQEPDYTQPQALFLAIESAVGQAVVPALTAKFAQELADTEILFSPLAERLGSQGIATWSDAVNEHVLRAVGARMLQARGKVREAQMAIHRHERQGYWYTRKFFDLLATYQGDRQTYPTLDSYYPRLMLTMSFWKDAGEHQRIETSAKRFMGPLSAALEEHYLKRTILVRPEPKDPALKKQADTFVKNLVARYRERYGVTLTVMTPLQASAADPAQSVFLIYGTPESNAYLKALLRYLPIKVSKGDMHLGARQIHGSDLRLVTAIPNPYNPTLPFRIVTGTNDAVVLSDLTMPDTQTDFVVYKGGKPFQKGDYLYDEKGSWRVP
ncbi:hypothetical protein D3C72_148580 [compost metagenome]